MCTACQHLLARIGYKQVQICSDSPSSSLLPVLSPACSLSYAGARASMLSRKYDLLRCHAFEVSLVEGLPGRQDLLHEGLVAELPSRKGSLQARAASMRAATEVMLLGVESGMLYPWHACYQCQPRSEQYGAECSDMPIGA